LEKPFTIALAKTNNNLKLKLVYKSTIIPSLGSIKTLATHVLSNKKGSIFQ